MVLPVPAIRPSTPRLYFVALFVAGLLCLPEGCAKVEPVETPPPAVVKWQGASENALEEWTELVGTTVPLPNRIARVSTRVEGTVATVLTGTAGKLVAEGQEVGKGTVLAQLDTTTVKNSLADAEATQQSLVEDHKQAQLAADQAAKEVVRLKGLEGDGTSVGMDRLVSAVEIERANNALKDARSKLEGAAARERRVQAVDAVRDLLKHHTLTAPISERIGRIQVVPVTLAVGTTVADVLDIDEQIDVLCFVPGSRVNLLGLKQPAHTGSIEEEENEADGEVVFIANQAEPETGNFAVKVRFDNKKKHLRANRIVRISVQNEAGPVVPEHPETAVQEDEETPTVVVVLEEQRRNAKGEPETVYVARRLQVELGVRDRKLHQVEVLRLMDPDKEGEKKKPVGSVEAAQFVVEGGQGLQTGDLVKQDAGDD